MPRDSKQKSGIAVINGHFSRHDPLCQPRKLRKDPYNSRLRGLQRGENQADPLTRFPPPQRHMLEFRTANAYSQPTWGKIVVGFHPGLA